MESESSGLMKCLTSNSGDDIIIVFEQPVKDFRIRFKKA